MTGYGFTAEPDFVFVLDLATGKTDLMDPFPKLKAYYGSCFARPAWQRTLGLYAERLGVSVDDIR